MPYLKSVINIKAPEDPSSGWLVKTDCWNIFPEETGLKITTGSFRIYKIEYLNECILLAQIKVSGELTACTNCMSIFFLWKL